MHRRSPTLLSAGLLAVALLVSEVTPASAPPDDEATAAAGAECESIDGIIAALYEVISGPKGEERDWERLRSLFHEEARLVPILRQADRSAGSRVLTLDEFIEIADSAFANDGFYESEVARETEQFAHIAHVFSTYEVRRAADEDPFIRGINSIQLVHDGKRWWVLSIVWDTEREGTPIPDEYRSGPQR